LLSDSDLIVQQIDLSTTWSAPAQVAPAVVIDDLWIRYRTSSEAPPSLKRGFGAFREYSRKTRYVEALRGVTFEVPVGSVYGVVGHNGAGKSTLFRAVAGILAPTKGAITVAGRVTPLLALGVGFNRELTGRENILLGGLAIGLDPDEIMDHYDEIVAFADLGEALDSPMRTYSSGMFGRLGFAVAAHLEPEILLIDEALAAGDNRYKNRCMDKLYELCGLDCTVMIISHGLSLIKALADRCVWLEDGLVKQEGHCEEVVDAYLSSDDMSEDDDAAMEDL
jgi:ABC-type polysaccharide/polyol phosphate transport system ATPase subunit